MTNGQRLVRNIIAWAAIGYLLGNWLGMCVTVCVYFTLD